jgi:tetraacyldisaccharide-1-P 4'-kinase
LAYPLDLDKIIKESQVKSVDAIVVTEKDAARISNLACINYQLPIFVLRIELRIIKDETKLHNRLLQLYTS